jgi:hypothetical protein
MKMGVIIYSHTQKHYSCYPSSQKIHMQSKNLHTNFTQTGYSVWVLLENTYGNFGMCVFGGGVVYDRSPAIFSWI